MRLSDFGLFEFRGYLHSNNLNVTISAQNNIDEIYLLRLEADEKGKGHGTNALKRLKAFGRSVKKNIRLTAVADCKCNQGRLESFYIRNGFVRVNDEEFLWTYK